MSIQDQVVMRWPNKRNMLPYCFKLKTSEIGTGCVLGGGGGGGLISQKIGV